MEGGGWKMEGGGGWGYDTKMNFDWGKPALVEPEPSPGRTSVFLMPTSSFVAKMFSIPIR